MPYHFFALFVGGTENFMEGDSMSEGQSMTSSLPRDLEKSSPSKAVRMGVAFDPSAGPAEPDQAPKVRTYNSRVYSSYMTLIGVHELHGRMHPN